MKLFFKFKMSLNRTESMYIVEGILVYKFFVILYIILIVIIK